MKRVGTIIFFLSAVLLIGSEASAQVNSEVISPRSINLRPALLPASGQSFLAPLITTSPDTQVVTEFDSDQSLTHIRYPLPSYTDFHGSTYSIISYSERMTSTYKRPYLDSLHFVMSADTDLAPDSLLFWVRVWDIDSSHVKDADGNKVPFPGANMQDTALVRANVDMAPNTSYVVTVPMHSKRLRGRDFMVEIVIQDTLHNKASLIVDGVTDTRTTLDYSVDRMYGLFTAHFDADNSDSAWNVFMAGRFATQAGDPLFSNLMLDAVVHDPAGRGVEELSAAPGLTLVQNYPNPASVTTDIGFTLEQGFQVSIRVYNPLGQLVATPVSGRREAGEYSIPFGTEHLASGTYTYVLEANGQRLARQMIVAH